MFALCCLPLMLGVMPAAAQAAANLRQLGTVKAVASDVVTLATASGAEVSVTVPADARVVQLPPGTTDLKAGTPGKAEDIAAGDRMLAIGVAGDAAGSMTAVRVVLMKSGDIAARNAAEQADWQKRGTGGLVKTVEGGELTVASGARTVKIETTPKTVFKRYADDSVAFADAKPSTLTGVHAGDQLRARGALSVDRTSLTAEEIVSGTFDNFSGVVSAVDGAAHTITLKDLASKKAVTVAITPKSDLRKLPPEMAARFGGHAGGPGATAAGSASGVAPAGGGPVHSGGAGAPASGAGTPGRRGGAELSQMLSRMPVETAADVKAGDTVMVVATQESAGVPTVLTLLSGVEGILASTPSGGRPLTLTPWNIGEPGGGGEQ